MSPSTIGEWEALIGALGFAGLCGFLFGDWLRRYQLRRSDPDEGLRALRRACWRARKELARVDRIATDLLEHRDVDVA